VRCCKLKEEWVTIPSKVSSCLSRLSSALVGSWNSTFGCIGHIDAFFGCIDSFGLV